MFLIFLPPYFFSSRSGQISSPHSAHVSLWVEIYSFWSLAGMRQKERIRIQLGNHILVASALSSGAQPEMYPDVIYTAWNPILLQDKFPGGGRTGGSNSSSLMGFHPSVGSVQCSAPSDGRGSSAAQSHSLWLHSPLQHSMSP